MAPLYVFLLIYLPLLLHAQRRPAPGKSAAEVPAAVFEPTMVQGIDLSGVPNTSPKPSGSGTCRAGTFSCPADCERCWESCGSCVGAEDVYGCSQAGQWVLSFDDGPSDYTPELLDVLRRYNIKAVFSILGGRADRFKDTIRRMYSEGHQIVSHSWSHPHLNGMSTQQVIAEIVTTERALTDVISVKPKYFRPPYGEADERIKGILRAYGLTPLFWNMDSLDYEAADNNQPFTTIVNNYRNALSTPTGLNAKNDSGFIALNHDIFLQTVRNMPNVIDLLRASGVTFTTVANCRGDGTPYRSWTGALVPGNVNGGVVLAAGTNATTPSAQSGIGDANVPASSGSSGGQAMASTVVTFGG